MSLDTANLIYAEKRSSQWELMMRKFYEVHKAESVSNAVEIPTVFRSEKVFPTNSKYEGTWNVLGISGYGVYTFPNGLHFAFLTDFKERRKGSQFGCVIYEGQFNDGMFEGEGEMRYPDGTKLRGTWVAGVIVDPTLAYSEEMPYDEDEWPYCKMPDRRFSIEHERGIQPHDKSYLTNDETTRNIPDGYFDTGEGFYHPPTKTVYKYKDLSAIVRIPSEDEQQWIVENCRTSPDLHIGPGSNLFEEFQRPSLRMKARKTNEASMRNFYDPDYENRRMSDDTVASLPQKLLVPPKLFEFQNSPYLSF